MKQGRTNARFGPDLRHLTKVFRVKRDREMQIISFIERGQRDVVERILRHCGLWAGPIRTLAK